MLGVTDAEARANALVKNLKKPRPDLFETPRWQFFFASSVSIYLMSGRRSVVGRGCFHCASGIRRGDRRPVSGLRDFGARLLRGSRTANTDRSRVMGESVFIGDTPEAQGGQEKRRARLTQLVTVGLQPRQAAELIPRQDEQTGTHAEAPTGRQRQAIP